MATYAEKTDAEKARIDYFSNTMRALNGEFAKSIQKVQALKDYFDATGLGTILGSIDNSEMIPNKTGLGGAEDITKAETMILAGNLATILTTYDTQELRLIRVKAAGINASL